MTRNLTPACSHHNLSLPAPPSDATGEKARHTQRPPPTTLLHSSSGCPFPHCC